MYALLDQCSNLCARFNHHSRFFPSQYTATFKYSDNLDYLMKTTLEKVYVPYAQEESSEEVSREQMLFASKTQRRRFKPTWPSKPSPK